MLSAAILVLSLLNPALADGKKKKKGDDRVGIRLKMTAPIISANTFSTEIGSVESDPVKTRELSVFNGTSRLEATYMLGDGLEVGLIAGYGSTQFDGDTVQSNIQALATGSYNFALGEDVRGFVQPIVGIANTTVVAGTDNTSKYVLFGAAAGARFQVIKRATVDYSLEYLRGNGKAEVDGDAVEDYKETLGSLRFNMGLSVVF